MTLSIIIPALNEAANLPPLLSQLQALQERGAQVLVADGGSNDGSQSLVGSPAEWLAAPHGRARQMNAGAAQAHQY